MSSLLGALLLAASVTASPEAVVHDFYAAYAAGDARAAAKLWTSAHAPGTEMRLARTFHTRCHVVHELDVGEADFDGDAATVRAAIRITRWSAMPGARVDTEHQRMKLTLRRENGAWRIDGWQTAEEEFAAREDEAHCVPPELRNRRMVQELARRAILRTNETDRLAAARNLARARAVAAELDDLAAQAEVFTTEGVLVRYPPHHDVLTSIVWATRAVELAEEGGDPDTLAGALVRLSRAHSQAGTGENIPPAERALALGDYVEDAALVALAASRLAQSYDDNRRFGLGLRYSKIAARYAAISGDPAALLNASLNLSGTFWYRGDPYLALQHGEIALQLAEKAGFALAISMTAGQMAEYELALGNHERVRSLLDRALSALGTKGNVQERAETYGRKYRYHMAQGDLAAAEDALRQADAIMDRPPGVAPPNIEWAWLRFRQGHIDEAAWIADQLDNRELRAAIFRATGRTAEAKVEYERILDGFDRDRLDLDTPLSRSRIVPRAIFTELIELHADDGESRQALAAAQRMKARVLQELIAEQGPCGDDDYDVDRLERQLYALNRRYIAIQRDGGDTAAIRAELRRARGALDTAILARQSAQLPGLDPRPADPSALRAPDGITVVEYVVGSNRTTAFVVRGDRITVHRIDAGAERVRAKVQELVRAVEHRDAKYRPLARRAYDLLLRPLLGAVPRDEMLCIIPDDHLWTLPFQALVAGDGRHLVEHAPLFYAPSFSLLMQQKERSTEPPTVLALGDPSIDFDARREIRADHRDASLGRLPDAGREVDALRAFYGERAETWTGPVAAEGALKRNAGYYDMLHFATHGLLDDYSPMYSALLLAGSESEDGLLEAREILELPLQQTDLVVLSACNSARGEVAVGEGVLGLSWAFLATGCPRTVATQWRVGSAAAARLMIAFHKRMARRVEVARVAEALREAQLEMLSRRQYAHPYYWAGFVLIGREH